MVQSIYEVLNKEDLFMMTTKEAKEKIMDVMT